MRFPITVGKVAPTGPNSQAERSDVMVTVKRKNGKAKVKQNQSGDLEYLTFPMLEETGMVRHLFSTRLGGVSKGIFSSMNLSYTRGDEKEAVDENYRRIADVLGCEVSDIVCSDQTHTTHIRVVKESDKGKGILFPRDYTDVDGLITNIPGIVLATFYADCVPLFFYGYKKPRDWLIPFRLARYGRTDGSAHDRSDGKRIRHKTGGYYGSYRALHLSGLL